MLENLESLLEGGAALQEHQPGSKRCFYYKTYRDMGLQSLLNLVLYKKCFALYCVAQLVRHLLTNSQDLV